MSFEKSVIVSGCTVFSDVKEHTLEADLVLPDYYSNINKVLKFSVTPYEEMLTFSGDRVSIAGVAMINLLYIGDDNKLCSYDNEIKYTKVIPAIEAENNDSVRAEQYVPSLNYRVLGPKRIELRATLAIKVQVERLKENSILSQINDESIQRKCGEITELRPHCVNCRELNIHESVPAPELKNALYILRSSAKYNIGESKAIKNKLMIKGSCHVETVYVTEENNISAYSFELPFTEVVEALGLEDGDMCDISVDGCCAKLSLSANGSDKCELDTLIKLKLHIMGYAENSLMYFEDAYAISANAENSYVEADMIKSVKNICESVSVNMEADAYDDGLVKICDCYVDSITACVNKNSDGAAVTGSVNFNAILADNENHYSLISRSAAFEHVFNCEYCENCDYKSQIDAADARAAIRDNGKIQFAADIKITLHVAEKFKAQMISDITLKDKQTAEAEENVILYYGRKGENLWDIAKSNLSSINIIKESNNITEECLKEDKLLIFSNF